MQAKLPFLRLLSVPPFNACVPKYTAWIANLRLVTIATHPSTAIVSRLCLKFLVRFRVPVLRFGILITLDLPDQLYIFTLQTFVLIAFMYFSHPFW